MKVSTALYLAALFILPLFVAVGGEADSSGGATQPAGSFPLMASTTCLSSRSANHKRQPDELLFDDFNYSRHEELIRRGWVIRSAPGWPGVPGATWGKENVSFEKDPGQRGNRLLRMTSLTDGTSAHTSQTQICHQRKYLEGTYAARVRFSDKPVAGPDGDQVVETFYTISPLAAPMDPNYSELDYEYLPNGGWGHGDPTLMVSTWETFSPEPEWKMDNASNLKGGSLEGWHILVTQVMGGEVKYFLDGELLAGHGGRFYPESLMSINFNLWFIKEGLIRDRDLRRYSEDIDWVFYEANVSVSPAEIENKVKTMRQKSIEFQDTVRAPVPPLKTPCNF